MSPKNLLIFTDIGDDIDDSLALTYLLENTNHKICAVITSHGNIDYRLKVAQELFTFFDNPPPLIWGTKELFSKQIHEDNERLCIAIKQHLSPREKITILCLCAATDLAHLIFNTPEITDVIEEIRYQWIIEYSSIWPLADLDSYNFKTDPAAIHFCLTQNIPHQKITKHDAYKHPFREQDFLQFTKKADLNEYLLSKALTWQSRFKELNHAKRQEVYGPDPTVLSYPYDLLVAQNV